MSGMNTANLPLPTVANGMYPIPAAAAFVADTGAAAGVAPATVKIPFSLLASLGFGVTVPLTDAATIALDASAGNYFTVTMAGNRTFAAFANPSPGQEICLEITQDGTGSRTATWNANVSWAAGTAPTLTTTAGATDLLRFTYNATAAKWRGETVGKAYA